MNVSSSHFLVIQSTPPINASGLCSQGIERETPALQKPIGLLVRAPEMLLASSWNPPLDIERADRLAIFHFHEPFAESDRAKSPASPATASRRVEIVGQKAFFEQSQDAGGRADLQRGGERTHVGVADEQMQPAIFAIIGQRLVARVDDGAIELHPLINVVHDVIGPLAELEIDRRLPLGGIRNRKRADSPARPGRRR